MKKVNRVIRALHRQSTDKFPLFLSATPQFLEKWLQIPYSQITTEIIWTQLNRWGFDIMQIGHASFYPVKVTEFGTGSKYRDDWGRTHVISEYYDDFCAPFPLCKSNRINVPEIREKWEKFVFPDPVDGKWFGGLFQAKKLNENCEDPLCLWGVINGPFEPTWQLISDGWPAFFILARKDRDLADAIIGRVTDYCIRAGQEMIRRGVDAIRIGDDYALNGGLMVKPRDWHALIYPHHKRLVEGLKK